ncbi:hypothetical protein CLOM_g16649, partial [Closterium sp. NIES-68]
LAMVIRKHADIFPDDLPAGLPPERDHKIELEPGAQPTVRTQWRLTQPKLDELQRQLDYLLEKGFVYPNTSPFAAPILFTPKKDGGLQMCIDNHALNRIAIKSRYTIPRANELIDQLRGVKVFSKIDLRGGYHQIRMNEADCYKRAFRSRSTDSSPRALKYELEFLGHVISIVRVNIDPKKIAPIQDSKPPTTLRELQSFLGFVNYVLFLTNTVRLHSIPSAIISDRDTRFTSNFWTKTWQQYGTRLHLPIAYHPQSDGQTERTNQTMEQLIRTTCTDPVQWEDALPLVEFAYNNALSAMIN